MIRSRLVLGWAVALLLLPHTAGGVPLDAEACGKLDAERIQLEFAGARTNMDKGPEWAKKNLSPDALKQVGRLIEVDAQLLFRCTGPNLVNLPTDPDPDSEQPAASAAKNGKDAKEPAATAPAAKANEQGPPPKKKNAAAAGKGEDGARPPSAAKKQASPPDKAAARPKDKAKDKAPAKEPANDKTKPKAKAKVDDAYRPPPPADPKADPFARQLAPAAK